eukprot:TRINITY_DN17535_c0_g1_i1.p1 TRINITY_DN17535_c0_g1~~TRINITY_DN17535_c0_g1_i1.p1  ORF type:complete len:153 (+),score=5.67 TRINITY_DN17535_c0_g1_i1:24-461(+)
MDTFWEYNNPRSGMWVTFPRQQSNKIESTFCANGSPRGCVVEMTDGTYRVDFNTFKCTCLSNPQKQMDVQRNFHGRPQQHRHASPPSPSKTMESTASSTSHRSSPIPPYAIDYSILEWQRQQQQQNPAYQQEPSDTETWEGQETY